MKKIMFVATVVKGHIDVFHIPFLKMCKEEGWETHVCAKNNYDNPEDCVIPYCDKFHDINFERQPFKVENYKSYKQLKNILDNDTFDIIHCHTPVGGVVGRLAAKNSVNNHGKIIYTAHGFHFFKGAPIKNWLLFYPVEKYLSRYTDTLININKEDYEISKNNLKAKLVKYVPGVGVDTNKFYPVSSNEKKVIRKLNKFSEEDFIIIYVGELSKRKNQKYLLNLIPEIKGEIDNIKLLLVGTGQLESELKQIVIDLNIGDSVSFLGYRSDINDLMNMSDVVISTSLQEGLPVNIMEGLAEAKPIVASNCRGNRDLVIDEENGFVVNIGDNGGFVDSLVRLSKDKNFYEKCSENSLSISKQYDLRKINEHMEDIYFKS